MVNPALCYLGLFPVLFLCFVSIFEYLSKLWGTVKDRKPGMLQSMELQRVGPDLATEQQAVMLDTGCLTAIKHQFSLPKKTLFYFVLFHFWELLFPHWITLRQFPVYL